MNNLLLFPHYWNFTRIPTPVHPNHLYIILVILFYIILSLFRFITYSSIHIIYFLFFIQYTFENTLKLRCFFFQVNHEQTITLQMNSLHTGDYHVNILSRYPNDSHLCDYIARQWLKQYIYHLDYRNGPVYGTRMLFGPNYILPLNKYI